MGLRTAVALFSVISAGLVAAPAGSKPIQAGHIRDAAAKTIRLLEKAGDEWKVPCVSCHHQGLAMLAIESARMHGIPINATSVQAHAAKTMKTFSRYEFAVHVPVDTFGLGYGLLGAHAAGVRPSISTAILTKHISAFQQPEGYWPATDARPPHSYSKFASTAISARVLQLYLPQEFAAQREQKYAKARNWFNSEPPQSTEDRTFRLLGLLWTGASFDERRNALADLLAAQQADGGWSQVAGLASDAYATGEALVALRQAGNVTIGNPAFRRGIDYLLKTQNEDGSWLVKSRLHSPAVISPPFFDSGFPGGKDQFISCAASAWAAMALMEALPEIPNAPRALPVPEAEPKDLPSWAQVAVVGSVDDLRVLLDGGLDPNSKTNGGTTLLMLAAPDVDKMELLIDRGADVNAQANSGETALNVAASYGGSAPAMRLLIAHGAVANPPGAKLEATPLSTASGSGDAEVVSVLLENGVRVDRKIPSDNPFASSPLFSAVQNDSFGIVRLLAKNDANLNEKDGQEMTALIWAALAHRTEMVKVLLELGADPAITDKYGYTALRHTADIAGADPRTADVLNAAALTKTRASVR